MHCQPEGYTHPPLPVPSFPLVQNLSSKQMAPTDNIWPKTDYAKRSSVAKRIKPLGCLQLEVSTIERKLPAAMMDMPATLWKHSASLPLSAEACQLTTSIKEHLSTSHSILAPSPLPLPHPYPLQLMCAYIHTSIATPPLAIYCSLHQYQLTQFRIINLNKKLICGGKNKVEC